MMPINPWLCRTDGIQTAINDAESRLSMIRASTDRYWLTGVVSYAAHQQKSVTEAAQRRLRVLAREQSRCT